MRYLVILLICSLMTSQAARAVKGNCQESYVPPYETEDLRAVESWSTGGAISYYAKKAGFEFDNEAYMEDCPYVALFNFGRATATTCLEVDVLGGYISGLWVLDNLYRKSMDQSEPMEKSFAEKYYEYAIEWGFDRYLKKVSEMEIFWDPSKGQDI